MDLISNHPYWPIQSGLIRSYPPLRQTVNCDVVVIGGGITGALCAYYLAKDGLDVIVVDKRDVASGSTSASTALIQYELDTHLIELIERFGERSATQIYRASYRAVESLEQLCGRIGECTYTRKPSVYLASQHKDVKKLRKEFQAREVAGLEVEWLDRREIERDFSFTREAAIYSHRGGEVDVYRLTHRLFESTAENGLRIFDRTEVELREAGTGGVTFTTPENFSITAKWAVFATGYEVVKKLGSAIVNLNSSYAFVSEPVESFAGWWQRCLLWETARPYLYFRTTADDRVIVGGEDSRFRNPSARDALVSKKSAKLEKQFRAMFPQIELVPAYAWAGTFGETEDGLPYIGPHPDWPNCFFSLGFGGNGILYSLMAAEIATATLRGNFHEDAHLFAFER